eukprot:5435245-Amphidinium_carterae.1
MAFCKGKGGEQTACFMQQQTLAIPTTEVLVITRSLTRSSFLSCAAHRWQKHSISLPLSSQSELSQEFPTFTVKRGERALENPAKNHAA